MVSPSPFSFVLPARARGCPRSFTRIQDLGDVIDLKIRPLSGGRSDLNPSHFGAPRHYPRANFC